MDRPQVTPAERAAIRALFDNNATPDQQQRFVWWMVNINCQMNTEQWRADQRMTDLGLGQALPAQRMILEAQMPLGDYDDEYSLEHIDDGGAEK